MIVDCKDPYLQEWILQLNNTPQTNGYTMKVEQRRPRLKIQDIYALAHKHVSEREALDRLNRGDKTGATYTHRSSPHKMAVNKVNADATADPNNAKPTDGPVNAVGHPKLPAKKTPNPGSKPPPSNLPVWVPLSKHWKNVLEKFLQLYVVPLLLLAAGVGFLLLVFDEENVLLLKYKHPRITQCQR